MARCSCGTTTEARRVIPAWLIIVGLLFGIIPGIVALYCHNRLVACGECGHIRWQF